MQDEATPSDLSAWMKDRNWGAHHYQWHFERRWDVSHARASKPDAPAELVKLVTDRVGRGNSAPQSKKGRPAKARTSFSCIAP